MGEGEGEGIGEGLGFTTCDGEGKGVGVGVGVKVAGGDGVSVAVLEGVGLGVAVWRRQSHSSRIATIASLSLQKSRKGRSEKQLIAGEPEYLQAPRSRNQRGRVRGVASWPTHGDAVSQLNLRSTILDGEIVTLDKDGLPRFQLLQNWQKKPTAPVVYYLFYVLWSGGRDLTSRTILHRHDRLEQIITPVAGIQVGGYIEARGKDLFQLAKEKGLEGIIAKRKTSTYQPGRRSLDWLKIKSRPQQEFVVCGFTEGKGSRSKHFGALHLAAYRNGRLRYFRHSGTGFNEKRMREALER
jgi:hypothetical protein